MTPTGSKRRRASNDEQELYEAQLKIFLDPNDPAVIERARADGVPEAWLEAARRSPIWKMAMEWKVAFPLHPEYRTLPMVWYVPPLSPITSAAEAGKMGIDGGMPDVKSLRIPVRYLANLLTAGDERPVADGLERMLAMRAYMRAKTIDGVIDESDRPAMSGSRAADRGHVPRDGDRQLRGPLRHSDGSPRGDAGRLRVARRMRLLVRRRLYAERQEGQLVRRHQSEERQAADGSLLMKTLKVLSALLGYPTPSLLAAAAELKAILASEAYFSKPAQCAGVER